MGIKVYANNMEIACKAGSGKVTAAFPDTCMSPPPPPTGPIPTPYPDSSFSKDMKNGSRTVKIGRKPIMLKDRSFYKTSPLGDEAATNNFGANLLNHGITGKTFFAAWSIDIIAEAHNVPRHADIVLSNCRSYPGTPGRNTAVQNRAKARIDAGKCPCCNKNPHVEPPAPPPAGLDLRPDWYGQDRPTNLKAWYERNIKMCWPNEPAQSTQLEKFRRLHARAKAGAACTCESDKTRVLPKPPCDVFFIAGSLAERKARSNSVKRSWGHYRKTSGYQRNNGIKDPAYTRMRIRETPAYPPIRAAVAALSQAAVDASIPAGVTNKFVADNGRNPTPAERRQICEDRELDKLAQPLRQVDHLTPKVAGGCPTGGGNLQPHRQLCPECREIDDEFGKFQGNPAAANWI